MMVGNIKFQYASLWVQIWDALLDMIPPQVAKEVGNRIGLVEEVVERKQRQDDLSFFMRVRVAMPIVKPIRKGEFIAGSDGLRTWVKFKYERLSMFCHYCGVLGHDVKHCASHFAVVNNGGEITYPYGDFLRAMGGRPRPLPSKNAGSRTDRDQISGDLKNDRFSPVGNLHGETVVEGMRNGNLSTMEEGESDNHGFQPQFRQLDNADSACARDVAEENLRNMPTGQLLPDSNSVQRRNIVLGTAGLHTVANEGLTDKSGGVDFGQEIGAMDQGLDHRMDKAGPSSLKPKSTWTKFNRMDFGLGGLSKALQL